MHAPIHTRPNSITTPTNTQRCTQTSTIIPHTPLTRTAIEEHCAGPHLRSPTRRSRTTGCSAGARLAIPLPPPPPLVSAAVCVCMCVCHLPQLEDEQDRNSVISHSLFSRLFVAAQSLRVDCARRRHVCSCTQCALVAFTLWLCM